MKSRFKRIRHTGSAYIIKCYLILKGLRINIKDMFEINRKST